MEQLFGYPEASGAARLSYEGVVELIAFPAGLLIILGLFTRPVGLALAVLYFVLFFVGPLQRGWFTHRNGGDPILLNAFFFLYLAAAGGGAWRLDQATNERRRRLDAAGARSPSHRRRMPVHHARPREVLLASAAAGSTATS